MKKMLLKYATLTLTLLGATTAFAQALTQPKPTPETERPRAAATKLEPAFLVNPDPTRYLFEDQLRPGMTGYGLTVMKAGKIEKFTIEIIDVMRNFTPGTNAILVKCSGLGLEHSGIIAGMSGSPVYVQTPDGPRMIGAIAFGWGSSKDPIGGVQPIRQMLNIPIPRPTDGALRVQAPDHGGLRWATESTNLLRRQALAHAGWKQLITTLATRVQGSELSLDHLHPGKGFHTLESPLMVSGVSGPGMAYLKDAFAGTSLVPMEGGASGGTMGGGAPIGGVADLKADDIKLEPGSAIAVQVLTGDVDLSGIGTVTEVRDGRVWAFGHAMLADGPTSLPIATSYIYTILPNLVQSFKVGTSYQEAGALVTDEQTGIVGQLGAKAATVPVRVKVECAGGQETTYRYHMAQHPRLAPEILGVALTESLTAKRQLPKQFTVQVSGTVEFTGTSLPATKLALDSLATSGRFDIGQTLLPLALLMDNPWENLKIKNVDLTAHIEPVNHGAEIKTVQLQRTVVAPGEEIVATVELVEYQQEPRKVEVKLRVPTDAAEGDYELCVGSSDLALSQEAMYFPQRFNPENVTTLVQDLQHILDYRPDRLYARLVMDIGGVTTDGHEKMNLPASRVALFASDKRVDALPVYNTVQTSVPAACVLDTGGETFTITVDRNAAKRFYTQREPGMIGGRPGLRNAGRPPMSGPTTSKPGPGSDGGGDGGDEPFK